MLYAQSRMYMLDDETRNHAMLRNIIVAIRRRQYYEYIYAQHLLSATVFDNNVSSCVRPLECIAMYIAECNGSGLGSRKMAMLVIGGEGG